MSENGVFWGVLVCFLRMGGFVIFGDSMSSVTAPAEKEITAKMEGF
jgi:hypothetical protein